MMRCVKCGYTLTGLEQPRCPECGATFDPSIPETFRDDRTPSSWAHRLSAALAAWPLVPTAFLYLAWVAGRIQLGHWPQRDDPLLSGWTRALEGAWLVSLLSLPVAGLLYLASLAVVEWKWRRHPNRLMVGLTLVGLGVVSWAVCYALCWQDPFDIGAWLFD